MEDKRNLVDEFKGKQIEDIVSTLDGRGLSLEIAIENTLRDYNMGTIVRNANAFGVRTIHVIGRRQWNKRGAMKTDAYMHIVYHANPQDFIADAQKRNIHVFTIDNNCVSEPITNVALPKNLIMVFGQEGPGVSDELRSLTEKTVHIPQLGSTRSMNVGVASGIALYEWIRQRN